MTFKPSLHDSIHYVVWTKRTLNVLRDAGIETFGQLCAIKEGEILRMPNAGRKVMVEIRETLARLGYCLLEDRQTPWFEFCI